MLQVAWSVSWADDALCESGCTDSEPFWDRVVWAKEPCVTRGSVFPNGKGRGDAAFFLGLSKSVFTFCFSHLLDFGSMQ